MALANKTTNCRKGRNLVLTKCRYLIAVLALLSFSTTSMVPAPAAAATNSSPAAKKQASAKKPAAKSQKTAAKAAKPQKTASKKRKSNRIAAEQQPESRYAALVVDADTGKVLYQNQAGNLRYPASLTKMMTLYLTFDALKRNALRIDQTLPVSEKAASQAPTNISLSAGDRLPMRTAIESVVVRSANDSAMVLAEAIGKTEWNFALMMTQKARELGMKNTVFRNPNGLPDDAQHTTAYDMARLAIALRRDFPEYYHYFSLRSFDYNGVTYTGHNRVLARFNGADGVKTGFIRASGFNLVTSARRNGNNLVAVVMGGTSATARDNQMINLLERSFAELETRKKNLAREQENQDADKDAASMTMELPPVAVASGTHG